MRFMIVVSALLVLVGCEQRLEIAEQAFACTEQADCAQGYLCRGATAQRSGTCVKRGSSAPDTYTPDTGEQDTISEDSGGDVGPTADAGSESSVYVVAGFDHACAAIPPSRIYCWGNNGLGQLGIGVDGTEVSQRQAPDEPVALAGVEILDSSEAMDAAEYATCIVSADGDVYCWGSNAYGRVDPYDKGGYFFKPVRVPFQDASGEQFKAVSVGARHACALTEDAKAYCWGNNSSGQLGNGTFSSTDEVVPEVQVDTFEFGVGEQIEQIAADSDHTCARTSHGNVYCWGNNTLGQLGDVDIHGEALIPNQVDRTNVSSETGFAELTTYHQTTCARASSGEVFCWGDNRNGETGTDVGETPVEIPTALASSEVFEHIAIGATHGCAITDDGEAYCWGANNYGALGISLTAQTAKPTDPVVGHQFERLALGSDFSCGVTTDNAVYCWGFDEYGRLGAGGGANHTHVPQRVALPQQ